MLVSDGKIARVNLSTGKIGCEEQRKYAGYMGGRGVNQRILFSEMPVGKPPFDPQILLAIGAGLLCGTGTPGASRISIDTKNPFTGGIGSSSVGGNFGPALKRAGVSNLILTGAAPRLSYLYIDDDRIEIRDAEHLREKTISEVESMLRSELGDNVQTMAIGPAGENLVWSACTIVNGSRAAARSGTGAVFGSKKLKAIVVKGTGSVDASDVERFSRICDVCTAKINRNDFTKRILKYGVYAYQYPWDIESPYRNFSGDIPPESKKKSLAADEFYKYLDSSAGCEDCPIKCWTEHRIQEKDGDPETIGAFQANAVHNFGAKLDMDDPRDVLRAHALCDELGLDEDVTSNVIAWAFACYEKGILGKDDVGNLDLEWGNTPVILELIERIAFRDGFGNVLVEGCTRAAKRIGRGSEDLCVHVKGNDLFECLWMRPAWALGTVVSPRGGTHTRGAFIENSPLPMPPALSMQLFGVSSTGDVSSYKNKEKLVVYMERLNAILDSLGMCLFTFNYQPNMLLPEDYAELLSAAVGKEISAHELLLIGERIHTVEKCFNVLHTDWTRKDDLPPKRFVDVPLAKKFCIDLDKWNELLDRYYDHHGWDRETGWPTKETLASLDLEAVYERLRSAGKVPAG